MIQAFSTQKLEKACKLLDKPVRSDKHLASVYSHINKNLLKEGKQKLPRKVKSGWYAKNYDIVFSDEHGQHAVELKSISSSFGKNFNNRIEEMTGQAFLSRNTLNLRSLSYVFIINETKETVDSKYISRLNDCATILMDLGLLKNFVLLRVGKSYSCYENKHSFKNWSW